MGRITAHEAYNKAKSEGLDYEQYKQLLLDNGIIIAKQETDFICVQTGMPCGMSCFDGCPQHGMEVFGKHFDVKLHSFEDSSKELSVSRKVTFSTGGEIYHYSYGGGRYTTLSSVVKENKETGKTEEVYSPWRHIPEGAYYEEIGRRLSIQQMTKGEWEKQ